MFLLSTRVCFCAIDFSRHQITSWLITYLLYHKILEMSTTFLKFFVFLGNQPSKQVELFSFILYINYIIRFLDCQQLFLFFKKMFFLSFILCINYSKIFLICLLCKLHKILNFIFIKFVQNSSWHNLSIVQNIQNFGMWRIKNLCKIPIDKNCNLWYNEKFRLARAWAGRHYIIFLIICQ
jgi:hypothetical protein